MCEMVPTLTGLAAQAVAARGLPADIPPATRAFVWSLIQEHTKLCYSCKRRVCNAIDVPYLSGFYIWSGHFVVAPGGYSLCAACSGQRFILRAGPHQDDLRRLHMDICRPQTSVAELLCTVFQYIDIIYIKVTICDNSICLCRSQVTRQHTTVAPDPYMEHLLSVVCVSLTSGELSGDIRSGRMFISWDGYIAKSRRWKKASTASQIRPKLFV